MIDSISFKEEGVKTQFNVYFCEKNIIVDINGDETVKLNYDDIVLLTELLTKYQTRVKNSEM